MCNDVERGVLHSLSATVELVTTNTCIVKICWHRWI